MLIINADDWGRRREETDRAFRCFRSGGISSASAMVFMGDSERAAALAKQHGVPVGLHLNLSQRYATAPSSPTAAASHEAVIRFLTRSKYAVLIYHPGLSRHFRNVFDSQYEEFVRLYGGAPTHIDGHQHRHLCFNVMVDGIIPRGLKIRRNFSFWPGEKGLLNRTYRRLFDSALAQRYRITDFFFGLAQCVGTERLGRVFELAASRNVELMTHPVVDAEYDCLMSEPYLRALRQLRTGSYRQL